MPSSSQISLDDQRWKVVLMTIKRHHYRGDALLEVLRTAQDIYGYLPREVLWAVSRELKLPPSRVYGVATFYHLFTLAPRGKHQCVVCLGTACYIEGAPEILRELERTFHVTAGETTSDGIFSLQTNRCIGTCGLAPAMLFDGQVAGHQSPSLAVAHVKEWRDDQYQ